MAIASLVIPLLIVIVVLVQEHLLGGLWKTMETSVLFNVSVFLANISGLYFGIRAVRSEQRRRMATLGIALNSILLSSGFMLLFGIVYFLIST